MAKSDLLKEAIADAKAVKETAIANAKIALQEAFAPRIQSMLSTKLSEELEGEEEFEDELDAMVDPDGEPGMDEPIDGEPGMEPAGVDVGDISLDYDADGEIDFRGDIYSKPEDDMGEMPPKGEPGMEEPDGEMSDEEMNADLDGKFAEIDNYDDIEEDLELEQIIRELEEGLYEDEEEKVYEGELDEIDDPRGYSTGEELKEDKDISAIIEAILAEDDYQEETGEKEKEEKEEKEVLEGELNEAYSTIKQLRSVINEVNLLNAKLLYTNKLFRNFELNESQKMKVIENFDRAANTREVKLVFSTLAESFIKPKRKRRIVKESYASKPTHSTAPSKETTKQIISEGNELAERWKKLAGLI